MERERYLDKLAEKKHVSIEACQENGVQVEYIISRTEESIEDTDRKEAQEHEAEMRLKLAKPTYSIKAAEEGKKPLKEYLTGWLEQYAKSNVRPNTYAGYERNIRNHVNPTLGNTPLNAISAPILDQLYRNLLKSGLAINTVKYVHRTLSIALEHAVSYQYIENNPTRNTLTKFTSKVKTPAPYTIEQMHQLIEGVKDTQWEFIIVLGGLYGMRRNEVLGLRWSNIDKAQGCFHIIQQLASAESKKATGEMLAVLKEDYSLRTLPITNEASIFFERQYARKNASVNSDLIFRQWPSVFSFIRIYEHVIDGSRVILFQIPAAVGVPTSWDGFVYGRDNESLVPINTQKQEQIRASGLQDWSRQIFHNANINDLNQKAIQKAREKFKQKYAGKPISDEIDALSDADFLNKAKLTINSQITKAALLLLGKTESDHLFEGFIPQISWKLQGENGEMKDYEHFPIPFLLAVDDIYSKIRNLRYRYITSQISLFPNEVDQYDPYIIRELLHNCIAHQNYYLRGRINVIEFEYKLMFINEVLIKIGIRLLMMDAWMSFALKEEMMTSKT